MERDFLKTVGSAARGVFFSSSVVPAPTAAFARKHRARYGLDPTPCSQAGYLRCRHLLDALDRARASTPADLERVRRDLPAPTWFRPAPTAIYAVREGQVACLSDLP